MHRIRGCQEISVFGSLKTYDLTDMWYDSLGSNPTSFEILLDLYLSFKVVLLFFFGSSLVEAFVAWSWSWTALHSVLYYSWPCSYMICSQISQILHIFPNISNIPKYRRHKYMFCSPAWNTGTKKQENWRIRPSVKSGASTSISNGNGLLHLTSSMSQQWSPPYDYDSIMG